jgi:hypothetical protein
MSKRKIQLRKSLPRARPRRVRLAMLYIISLAQYAVAYTRSWAANSPIARQRLKAKKDELIQEVALLKEEIRIKDARIRRIAPQPQAGKRGETTSAE